MAGFVYQDPFPLGKDETKYRLLEDSAKYVSVENFNGQEILKIAPEGLKELANKAMRDVFRYVKEHPILWLTLLPLQLMALGCVEVSRGRSTNTTPAFSRRI